MASLAQARAEMFRAGGAIAGGALFLAFAGALVIGRAMKRRLRAQAAEEQRRLDELVQKRTAELDERNRGMRFLLDHLSQGVVSVDGAGTLGDEH